MKRHSRNMDHESGGRQHPVVGWLALVAMVAAAFCILWLRVAFVGTRDVERTFAMNERSAPVDGPRQKHPHSLRKKAEETAAQSRWATGFSH